MSRPFIEGKKKIIVNKVIIKKPTVKDQETLPTLILQNKQRLTWKTQERQGLKIPMIGKFGKNLWKRLKRLNYF